MSRRPVSRFEVITDLTSLQSIAEDAVLATLRERYLSAQPYTSVSPQCLVSVNPLAPSSINDDDVLAEYVAEYYRSTLDEPAADHGPHVFRLALDAYYNMKRTRQDQIVVASGAVGSGKSEVRRLAIKAITAVSSATSGKKGAKVGPQIANAEFVLESFGNAHSSANDNASRYGSYTELQFGDSGTLRGVKTIDYYLERSRVSQQPPVGERNFHVFYYLCAGISGDERTHLKLGQANEYRYLHSRVQRSSVDDASRFAQLKTAFKTIGMANSLVAQVCQLLAAIVHLGNLDFVADDLREGAVVINTDVLDTVADFLGVYSDSLAELFAFKTMVVGKEVCSTMLDAEGAERVRDELARTLYALLFSWLNEHINQKLCKDSFSSFVALLDLPGPQNNSQALGPNSIDQFCFNLANEHVHNWTLKRLHELPLSEAAHDNIVLPRIPYFDNASCLKLLSEPKTGLVTIFDDQARKKRSDASLIEAIGKRHTGHPSFSIGNPDRSGTAMFTISHYAGPVTYSADQFLERNANETGADILRLLRGTSTRPDTADTGGSANPFVKSLFNSKAIATQVHPRNDETVVAIQQPVKPVRAPSTRRKRGPKLSVVDEDDDTVGGGNNEGAAGNQLQCVAGQHAQAISTLLASVDQAQAWFAFCLRPNDSQIPAQIETRSVRSQIRALGLVELAQRQQTASEVRLTHAEFCERYDNEFEEHAIGAAASDADRIRDLMRVMKLGEGDLRIGSTRVFLSHSVFRRLEDRVREAESDVQQQRDAVPAIRVDPFSPHNRGSSGVSPLASPALGYDSRNDSAAALPLMRNAQPLYDDSKDDLLDRPATPSALGYDATSVTGTDAYAPSRNMFRDMPKEKVLVDDDEGAVQEEYRESKARRRWVLLCRCLTWFIPDFALNRIGKMKRQDIRQAWREKLAINLIIWFICACTCFVIAGLGLIICPTQHVYSTSELASHNYDDDPNNAYAAIRGEVFDLSSFASTHLSVVSVVPEKTFMTYGGTDASDIFPVQVSALCQGTTGTVSDWVTLDSTNTSDVYAQYHDFRAFTNDSRPDWYQEAMITLRGQWRVGWMGYTTKDVKSQASEGNQVAIIDGYVYDLTTYISQGGGGIQAPNGTDTSDADRSFLADQVVGLFQYNSGKDITKLFNSLNSTLGDDVMGWQKTCLRNLFVIGQVDNRNSPQCEFSTYILLALSCVMVAIIAFKFLSALHFGGSRAPENHDKFVICQVPCYTEGEESLRRTIDSLVRLKYDDKRKLLLVICDGNIKGFGNEKPTPAIVLDILGVDPKLDPEPLSFHSLGEGSKQHNMGKVYAGLYECAGHVVPYLVVVKVGKPSERPKPGNRGKRDSQMLIMHFLNKVHYGAPMNPVELEMYHQIKNVIGVNPSFYEYLFMVDADTTVDDLSLNRLVSACIHDKKIIGICGETSIANAKQSIVTMSQVYEYFISHHLAKAFENLFSSITCLPGCFTMYRLRTPDTHKPLFIANQIVHDYSENRVDTLHLKNLLHLGEDRYLTTLVLKHFPTYKTKFVRDAKAQTVAPDSGKVLFSQRRRWINSTIHNMAELIFQENMCGFCCFSMRFVVLIDLVSTIVAPVTVAYIGYLIYVIVKDGSNVPILSIIMLAAIYGLQALVFIFRLRWDMIAWMVFYILAIPVFSLYLPLYAFWRMDDFSWGSTRLVVGDNGKKLVIHDEGKFDPRSIPLKSWNDYENELWDRESAHSDAALDPPPPKSQYSRAPSMYSYDAPYDPYAPAPYRSVSPQSSAHDLRAASAASASRLFDSPRGAGPDTRSFYGAPLVPQHTGYTYDGRSYAGSMYGDARSYHGAPAGAAPYGYPAHGHAYAGSVASAVGAGAGTGAVTGATGPGAHGEPSDAQLEESIKRICASADLDTLTKKRVRIELEKEYGVGLVERKDFINRVIERVLAV
ncbi:hypothetical protein Q5752_000022 [Cryptotrichosporon argae]